MDELTMQNPTQLSPIMSTPRPTPISSKKSTKKPTKDFPKESAKDSTKDFTMDTPKKSTRQFSLERFEKPSEHSSSTNGGRIDNEPDKNTGHLSGESSIKDISNTNDKKTKKESTAGSGRLPGDSSTKDTTKADSNGPLASHISSLKSGLSRVGQYFNSSSGGADSEKSAQGNGPEAQPNDSKHSRVCNHLHGHPPGSSQDAESGGHVCVLDPEPMADESAATREKHNKVADHTGHDELIGVIHPADCEEHPDAKAEHLVADNPRLGRMIAVYQKIEAKQKEVMDKLSKSNEDKEQKERVKREKQEAKEKKAREKLERREKRARERQERVARRLQEKRERANRATQKPESLRSTGGTDGTTESSSSLLPILPPLSITSAPMGPHG